MADETEQSVSHERRGDCAHCLVEGACIEWWTDERATRLGLPVRAQCIICSRAAEAWVPEIDSRFVMPGSGCPRCGAGSAESVEARHGCDNCGLYGELVEVWPGRIPATCEELSRQLTLWAVHEGLSSAEELIETYFVLPSVHHVHHAIKNKERVETNFDVTDFLFSGSSAQGSTHTERVVLASTAGGPTSENKTRSVPPSSRLTPASLRAFVVASPRDELLALASVAAADGEASVDDHVVLHRAAASRGIPPLRSDELRVCRPNELPIPSTFAARERVLEEMLQLALADGQFDESELRVIREFARAWGIDPGRLSELLELYTIRNDSTFERWLRRIGSFLFPPN